MKLWPLEVKYFIHTYIRTYTSHICIPGSFSCDFVSTLFRPLRLVVGVGGADFHGVGHRPLHNATVHVRGTISPLLAKLILTTTYHSTTSTTPCVLSVYPLSESALHQPRNPVTLRDDLYVSQITNEHRWHHAARAAVRPSKAATRIVRQLLVLNDWRQVPCENYRKVFRTSQKYVEKELGGINTTCNDASTKSLSPEESLKAIDSMLSRAENLKRKVSLFERMQFVCVADGLTEHCTEA